MEPIVKKIAVDNGTVFVARQVFFRLIDII